MNLTLTTSSSFVLALAGLWAAGGRLAFAQEPAGNRVVRPEGYLVLEGDAGAPSGKGSFSVVPASNRSKAAAPEDGADEGPGPQSSDDQYPPPERKTPRQVCQPQADRFAARLAVLRGNSVDGGRQPLDPAVQRAMFGRTALRATATDPDQPVAELTYDEELKDLYRAYQTCVKTERQRSRQ